MMDGGQDWSDAIAEVESEFDRAERVVEDVRERPGVAEVQRNGAMIEIYFDDRTTFPTGFAEWGDAAGLVIRGITVIPETDGFCARLAFVDGVDALSPQRRAAHRIAEYIDAGATRTAALDAWMCDDGPFSQTEWADVCGVGRQTIGDRVRAARRCERL